MMKNKLAAGLLGIFIGGFGAPFPAASCRHQERKDGKGREPFMTPINGTDGTS